jgi:hypothetical protein
MGMIVCLSVAHQYSSSKARITFMATDRLILQNYINNGLNLFFFNALTDKGKLEVPVKVDHFSHSYDKGEKMD